jgi:hypothetical protein
LPEGIYLINKESPTIYQSKVMTNDNNFLKKKSISKAKGHMVKVMVSHKKVLPEGIHM